jgi:hypothetical protein
VKRRGCWASGSSIRRYEKAAKTMSLSKKMPGDLKLHLSRRVRKLALVIAGVEAPVELGYLVHMKP